MKKLFFGTSTAALFFLASVANAITYEGPQMRLHADGNAESPGSYAWAQADAGGRSVSTTAWVGGCEVGKLCGGGALAHATYDYIVSLSVDPTFYTLTGLDSSVVVKLDAEFTSHLTGSGYISASARWQTSWGSSSYQAPMGYKASTKRNMNLRVDGSIYIQKSAQVILNTITTGSAQAYAYIDPILRISSDWEYAQYSHLFSINEGLADKQSVSDGIRPSAVPLPAGLPLLLAGLGALGIAGRRRRL